ncbi:MAG: hypothetical protein HY053_09640 [Proteobacteria bacterium]|nr:hypothetical protein [Pseudomonadota bacterium]
MKKIPATDKDTCLMPPAPASSPTPFSGKFFTGLALLGTVLAVWAAVWRIEGLSFFVYDDTYIFLRYAANFLHTGLLHWNLGDAVEGYTNPLHLLLITILGACDVDLLNAAHLVNGAAYAGCVAVLYWALLPRLGWKVALLPAGLMAAYPALIAWVWGGMEVPLTVFLLLCGHVTVLRAFLDPAARDMRQVAISAVFFSLAMLNRLDNALFAAPAALAWLYLCRLDRKKFLLFCGILTGVLAAHTLQRFLMYGDVLPNTFYAKVVGTPAVTLENGWRYVYRGLSEFPFFYTGGLGALLALALFRPALRAFVIYAFGGIVLSTLYLVAIGGDFMPGHRFMMPWLPACMLALGLLLEKPQEDKHKQQALRYAGLVLCLVLLKATFILPEGLRSIDGTALGGETVGKYIATHWPSGKTIALNAAGAIPYFNLDKTFIDMLGLNDRHIARRKMPDLNLVWQKKPGHGKGDGAYVLGRAPDFIILSSVSGDNGFDTPVLPSDAEIRPLPEFRRCYHKEIVPLPWPEVIRKQGLKKEPNFFFAYYRRVCPKPGS